MKSAVKYSLFAAVIAVSAALIALACAARTKETRNIACNDIEVEYADSFRFTTSEQIAEIIRRDYAEVLGRNIAEIDLARIESVLKRKSCIQKAEVWTTLNGKLHVKVEHRHPAAKFVRDGQTEFYADSDATLFPKTKGYDPEVPQITLKGNVPGKGWIKNSVSLLEFCNESKEWRGRLSGIESDSKGNISFLIDGGGTTFLFGQPEDFSVKFEKIETYLNTIAPGHDYSYVKLGYDGQIICK